MNIVVLIVHNRPQNIKQWLHCWQQCEQDAKLVIIHNDNGDKYDVPDGVTLITRPNIGFDIGAFQDVCLNKLPGFPEWDNLLWCTDDTLPMAKDFTKPFWEGLKHHAVVCMCISHYVRIHIRTTGFAIRKDAAEKLIFPADPITTKEQCYQFEHRSDNTFLAQIERLGLTAIQVAPDKTSPLFDTEYTRRIKTRMKEHHDLFGDASAITDTKQHPLVTFICPAFNAYPFIIHSLQQQTHTNWKLYLIHDGQNETGLRETVNSINDPRVIYEETAVRSNNWGHSIRSEWLQKVEGDFVVITNQDNYYSPVFIEKALQHFGKYPNLVAAYSAQIVHNYTDYKVMDCRLRRGYIDCGQVMLRTKEAAFVGWRDIVSHSSDWFFFNDIITEYGALRFTPFSGLHFFHN